MPNWKKVITSGSSAALNEITASGAVNFQNGLEITGSNSLSGNYVLKVTNTSGDNILNVENDGNVGIGISNPSTMLDIGTIDNPAAVTIRGKGNSSDSADYPKIILDGEWHGSADKMEINVGETTQYGGTIRSNDIALKNGNNVNARFNGAPSLPVNFNGNVVDFGGGILGTGRTLKIAENIQTYQHTSFVYDWLEWTGGNYGDQGYTFHTYTHKNLLALDGSTGRVGIGTSSPSAMLHVTGAIYTESNITASGHVSASTYYGDGSNLTNINVFPYTGSAIITGSLEISNTLFTTISSSVSTGTTTLYTFTNYEATHAEYKIKNGSNLRTGTVIGCWDGSNVDYTETSINGLGTTLDASFAFTSTGQLQITTSGTYEVKVTARAL